MRADDFLSEAISAARGRADDRVEDGASTRLLVRESLSKRGGARRRRLTLIAAVIASLFGSTAFAYWIGWRPIRFGPDVVIVPTDDPPDGPVSMRLPVTPSRKRAVATTPPANDSAPTPPSTTNPPPAVRLPVTSIPPPQPAAGRATTADRPIAAAPPSAVRTIPAPSVAPPTRAPSPTPASSPSPTAPSTTPTSTPRITTPVPPVEQRRDPELAAYGRAHTLHFRGSDPKAALAAWDAYLAAYPDGKLAIDARYNRALALVKLGRWADVRAALAPFATAAKGSYRQREAAQILSAIRDR